MLPQKYRLKTEEIQSIARKGKRLTSDMIDIRCWWDSNLDNSQFAFAVGLKVSKSAVIRNSIKRKMRAAINNILVNSKLTKGKYLIVAKSSDLNLLKSTEIEEVIYKLLTMRP